MALSYSTKLMTITALAVSTTVAASAATSLYVNPANVVTNIAEIELHNTNGSQASVILYYVPDNNGTLGSPSITSEVIRLNLAAYDTVWIEPTFPYNLTNTNESFWGVSSLSGVNVQLRGRKDQ